MQWGGGEGGCALSKLSVFSKNFPPSINLMSATDVGDSGPRDPSASKMGFHSKEEILMNIADLPFVKGGVARDYAGKTVGIGPNLSATLSAVAP